MSYLIQFTDNSSRRRVGVVRQDQVCVLSAFDSVYALFQHAEELGVELPSLVQESLSKECISYQLLAAGGRILPPLDHPDPYHTWVTGTGLTHPGSMLSRHAMHAAGQTMTDSMKLFQLGVENGKMQNNVPASQPEWFYKGNGLVVVSPGQDLPSPSFALEGSEEPEIAGLYIINKQGIPKRIGFSLANEFSDHAMEKINYLYLAHSKLRKCSYGPELLLGDLPECITIASRIIRSRKVLWEKTFLGGENNMSHNIRNLEYHHFKYDLFRQPGDVHIHFFGTSALSFSDGIELKNGDCFEIESDAFSKSLINRLLKSE